MADSYIRVPVDGLGKLVDTSQITVGLNDVQRERMIIGDNTDNNFVTVNSDGQLLALVELYDGTNVIGTSAHPVRTDPTGTTIQPVSWTAQTVTVTQGTGSNLHTVIDSGVITTVSTVTSVTAIANALPAGTNVIGHVITDTNSTTVVTGNVTVVQPTGTNLHAVIDSGSTTAVTGNVTVVQTTGTNLHTVVDSGTITAVTSITNQVDTNVKQVASQNATQGDVNNAAAATGSLNIAPIARYNATQPTLTDTRYNLLQVSSRGELLVAPGTTGFPVTFGSAQHVIVDSGTITAVTAITNALPAGTNVIGHVITDATSVVSATLTAETTKVIGVVRTSDGAGNLLTSNSTTPSGKFALDSNITSILGTAPTTAGFIDIKGADGNVFVRQATASLLNATIVGTLSHNNAAPSTTNIGVLPALANAAAPTYIEGDQVLLNTDLAGNLKVNIVTGAGSGGTAMTDSAVFTQATTSITPVGGVYTLMPQFLADSDGGAVRMTYDRRMLTFDQQSFINNDLFQQMLLELRALRVATVMMVTESGSANPNDFAPGNFQDMYMTEGLAV